MDDKKKNVEDQEQDDVAQKGGEAEEEMNETEDFEEIEGLGEEEDESKQ